MAQMGMSVFLSLVILVSMIIVDVCRCHCRWSMAMMIVVVVLRLTLFFSVQALSHDGDAIMMFVKSKGNQGMDAFTPPLDVMAKSWSSHRLLSY